MAGRLKIFLGAAAGVGKTFAMLEEARRRKAGGERVVVSSLETHGSRETQALLEGLECLPAYDLDAALACKPALVLVDELAASNAPGARHQKRWQDVQEMIEAGLDVFTTVNVQNLESQNDVVARITGVTVRERVPDMVLDAAHEIELVDLPVEDLLRRVREGRAPPSDLTDGKLIALRELAMRVAAERVDAQMQAYRKEHGIQSTWAVTDRLMVCVGPSPYSARLIRATRRLADQFNAPWIVVNVETPATAHMPQKDRDRLRAAMRMADQLGAETVTLSGLSVSETLIRYARERNVTQLVIGKPAEPLWRRLWKGAIVDDLIRASGDIEIHVLQGAGSESMGGRAVRPDRRLRWQELAQAAAVVAVCAGVTVPLRDKLAPTNLGMVYLLGVVVAALRCDRRAAAIASLLSVLVFDFFCVPPYLSFAVADPQSLLPFLAMLVVALVISDRTVRIREHAALAVGREARTHALYQLSRDLSGETRLLEVATVAAAKTAETFGVQAVIFLPDETGQLSFRRRTAEHLPVAGSEESVAQWVFQHAQPAGRGTETLPGAAATYLPLRGAKGCEGVLAVLSPPGRAHFSDEQSDLLEIFAGQIALSLGRARSFAQAGEAELRVQTERLRNSLLSALSHDLRTPLASITGAASTLLEQGPRLEVKTRYELVESIADEAERLSRLVNNLLEMTKLESGTIKLNLEWHPVDEILGAALHRLERILQGREVRVDCAGDLPMARVDDVLIEQVCQNLVENAVKHTAPGTPIDIAVRADGEAVVLEVCDRGAGFAPGEEQKIFDKFYRGKGSPARGAGLGLSICRAIVEAHEGCITARNREGGGAVLRVRLPLGGTPPQLETLE